MSKYHLSYEKSPKIFSSIGIVDEFATRLPRTVFWFEPHFDLVSIYQQNSPPCIWRTFKGDLNCDVNHFYLAADYVAQQQYIQSPASYATTNMISGQEVNPPSSH